MTAMARVALLTSLIALQTAPALAGDLGGGLTLAGNVGIVSEYSFRGIAQSDERPALQGGMDLTHESGLYAGFWGSNVDFNDGDEATVEVDFFAGYSGSVDAFTYDIGVIYYTYPGADDRLNYDFTEFTIGGGYDFDFASLSLALNYSPEFFGESGDAFYYAAALDIPLIENLTASLHAGYQSIDDNARFGVPDYWDYSAGLAYEYKGATLSAQYVTTDLSEPRECRDGCDDRVIMGLSYGF